MPLTTSASITARSGPLVAAMGAIAAGTLIMATLLGQSLGPIPIDNPAIAILPGSGGGAPLVLNLGTAPPLEDAVAPLVITEATGLGLADESFPPREIEGPITTISEEETTEPVSPEGGTVRRVQSAVSELVDAVTGKLKVTDTGKDKKASKLRRNRAMMAARKVAAPVSPLVKGLGVIDVEAVLEVVATAPVTEPEPEPAPAPSSPTKALSAALPVAESRD